MRQSKLSGNLKLSTVIAGLTVFTVVLYCLYILPLLSHPRVSDGADSGRIIERQKYDTEVVSIGSGRTPRPVEYIPSAIDKPKPAPAVVEEPANVEFKNEEEPVRETEQQPDLPLFPPPLTFSSSHSAEAQSVMVVGGTDGSGTRRVVQVLTQLGVIMVSEDPETYDIHADLVRGWPEVVTPVVASAHTLDYTPSQLDPKIQNRVRTSVSAILNQVGRDSVKPTSYRLAVGGVLPHPDGVTASAVKYGFKAPVAMTLSPWFAELSPHFKLVHVLRDGRDLSFSANQGPVNKFFASMYAGANFRALSMLPSAVKSIKLWSDWNSQVNTWAKRYVQEVERINSRDKSFGYFAVHSEDMVSPSVPVRFAAIAHLAGFVGSSLSPLQLCCLALQESGFMGSHDRTPINKKGGANAVSKRYGKWHALLANDAQLSDTIHREGKVGLEMFGYEPERVLADENMQSAAGFVCSAEKHSSVCGVTVAKPVVLDATGYGIQGVCTTKAGQDYVGGDIDAVTLSTPDKNACCDHCKARADCKFFVVDPNSSMCYLKSRNEGTRENNNLISGAMV